MRLEGKTALITGAARGIGRATALLFAQEGADVLTDVDPAELEETTAAVRQLGRQAAALPADIAHLDEPYAMVDRPSPPSVAWTS